MQRRFGSNTHAAASQLSCKAQVNGGSHLPKLQRVIHTPNLPALLDRQWRYVDQGDYLHA